MAETNFNIDSYIEDLKTAQKQAAAKKLAAEAAARKKKSESNAAKRVRAEANNKFQYAEGLGKTLIDFDYSRTYNLNYPNDTSSQKNDPRPIIINIWYYFL